MHLTIPSAPAQGNAALAVIVPTRFDAIATTTGLSNDTIEGLNGKIRTITRRAYGFHSAASLISFIFLCCTGLTLHPVFKTP